MWYDQQQLEEELEQETRLLREENEKNNQELAAIKDRFLNDLVNRLSADGTKNTQRIAPLIEELRNKLGK